MSKKKPLEQSDKNEAASKSKIFTENRFIKVVQTGPGLGLPVARALRERENISLPRGENLGQDEGMGRGDGVDKGRGLRGTFGQPSQDCLAIVTNVRKRLFQPITPGDIEDLKIALLIAKKTPPTDPNRFLNEILPVLKAYDLWIELSDGKYYRPRVFEDVRKKDRLSWAPQHSNHYKGFKNAEVVGFVRIEEELPSPLPPIP